jgi:SAM-dependent methyltransferase/methyltransferase-like protein
MDASYAAGYDEVLYDSVPVVGSHPAQLAAWATLHGLSAPPVATARILELGCGTGSNIVPIAADLPDAEVVAIDLSARQIERASARAAALGLTNLTCHALDLREVDDRFGAFDYVIAHGLYSWVPAEVRDAALALLGARLSPDGLAYVSFLTLPGWSFAGAFRDLALYHLRDVAAADARVAGFDDMVALLTEGVADDADARAVFLRDYVGHYAAALAQVGERRDAAIHHDLLAPINHALYLRDFVAHVARHGLAYVTDATRGWAMPAGVTDAGAARLAAIPDLVAREQYVDFLTMASLRGAILGRADRAPIAPGRVDPARLTDLVVTSRLRALSRRPDVLGPGVERFGYGPTVFESRSRLEKAALIHLEATAPRAIALSALAAAVATALGRAALTPAELGELADLVRTILGREPGALRVRTIAPAVSGDVTGTPIGRAVARAQLATTRNVVNHYHEAVALSEDQARVLALLDGTRDRAAVLDAWLAAVEGTRLERNGKPVSPRDRRGVLGRDLDQLLGELAYRGLLSAR